MGENINRYNTYPRIVGEAGGKNYHLAHESADTESLINATIRSAFEYSGQKCSACSRLYVPRPLWEGEVRDELVRRTQNLSVKSPEDFTTFFTAVIDEPAFDRIESYISYAKSSAQTEILTGGGCDKTTGYFVEPTIIETKDPNHKLMREEIFGPVLTVFVYEPLYWEGVLSLVDESTPYGLTGSLFARDSRVIEMATEKLRYSAGNYYINDKSTGSVVGQQPFGGARASGTNDKSGSMAYVMKWMSWMSIKENFLPLDELTYPYMSEK